MLTTVPSGARTQNRRIAHVSVVSECTISYRPRAGASVVG